MKDLDGINTQSIKNRQKLSKNSDLHSVQNCKNDKVKNLSNWQVKVFFVIV